MNDNFGYLVVAVSTANGTIPIEGARVRIYQKSGRQLTVINTLITDNSGITPTLTLPCPPGSASQSPGAEEVFSSYIVETDCEGYGSVQNDSVEIFDGVKSIQNVNLIPSRTGTEDETRYTQNVREEL